MKPHIDEAWRATSVANTVLVHWHHTNEVRPAVSPHGQIVWDGLRGSVALTWQNWQAQQTEDLLPDGMWRFEIGTVYNFCTYHQSLRVPGIIGGHKMDISYPGFGRWYY